MKSSNAAASLSAIIFLSVTLFSCNEKAVMEQGNQTFPVVRVVSKSVSVPNEYVARIRAVQNVDLRARVTGYLEEIFVDEGAHVKKDQILFRLNDREYRNQYEQARSAYQSAVSEAGLAELEVERTRMLVDKKVMSDIELRVAIGKWNSLKAKADEALSAMKHAELKLSHTAIRAPFDGVIDHLPFKRGSLLQEGDVITSVSDNDNVFAYFNVSEKEYLRLMQAEKVKRLEQEVSLKLADGSVYPIDGKIETMAGDFDANTGSIAFRARFANPDLLLRHGATATVVIDNIQRNAVLVPQRATLEIQDKTFVFMVGRDNKVKMTSISPKNRVDDIYVVDGGIRPGEVIVYEGIQYLKDGMTISPKEVRIDSLMAMRK